MADARAVPAAEPGLNRLAFNATVHCLTGCAIGEFLGWANRHLITRGRGHAVVHAYHH